MILIFILSYFFVAFIVFMVLYIFNLLEEDFAPAAISGWPLAVIVFILFMLARTLHKLWIVVGGPKIRRLAPNEREQERRQAHRDLYMAVCRARNAGIPDEEIARLARDSLVKEIMEY